MREFWFKVKCTYFLASCQSEDDGPSDRSEETCSSILSQSKSERVSKSKILKSKSLASKKAKVISDCTPTLLVKGTSRQGTGRSPEETSTRGKTCDTRPSALNMPGRPPKRRVSSITHVKSIIDKEKGLKLIYDS